MTYSHRVFDVKSQSGVAPEQGQESRRRSRRPQRSPRTDRDLHLLRLSLDLQLDAMLLTLGAAAADEVGDGASARCVENPEAGTPWRRWLTEDLELTRDLAATAISMDAALPPTLGAARGRAQPETMAGDLLARYESICALLTDVTRDLPPGGSSVLGDGVAHALTRCHRRLAELRQERAAVRGMQRPVIEEEHHYLGERGD